MTTVKRGIHRKHCVIIEGFPAAFGDSCPDFWTSDCVDSLISPEEIQIEQKIDPFGGVAEVTDLRVNLNDVDNRLAKYLQFYDENTCECYTYPIDKGVTVVSLSTSLHGTRKAMDLPGNAAQRVYPDPATWDFPASFTFEFWYNQKNETVQSQFLFRKVGQVLIALYNGGSGTKTIYVGLNPGGGATVAYFHNDNSVLNGWRHFLASYNHITGALDFYADGVVKSWAGIAASPSLPAIPSTLWGYATSTSYPALGDIGRLRVWKRALSATEAVAAYAGKPVDDTDIFFNSEWMEPAGNHIWSNVPGTDDLPLAPGATWVDRVLLRGDELYAPRDTWLVQSISGAVATVERPYQACTSAPNYEFYTRGASYDDYTCKLGYDGPGEYHGRKMAYYRDDGRGYVLKWLGQINSISQIGKSWQITGKHILSLLNGEIKPGFDFLRVDHAGASQGWCVDKIGVEWQGTAGGATGSYIWTPPDDEYFRASKWESRFNNYQSSEVVSNGPTWKAAAAYGLAFMLSGDQIVMVKSPATEGTLQALFDNPDGALIYNEQTNRYCSTKYGVKHFGVILRHNFKLPYKGDSSYVQKWLELGGSYFYTQGLDTYTDASGVTRNQVVIIGAYDKETMAYDNLRTAGISSMSEIVIPMVPIVWGVSFPSLIYRILMSTGDGTNNTTFDSLPGNTGIGINEANINSSLLYFTNNNAGVYGNIDGADISQELQAFGYALIFDDSVGKFKIINVRPPTLQDSVLTVTDDDLDFSDRVNVLWGYYQPLNSIEYKYKHYGEESHFKYSTSTNNTFGNTINNVKSFESKLQYEVTDEESFSRTQLRRLAWYSNYVPSIRVRIAGNDSLQVGQVVDLTLKQCGGDGPRYGITNKPALIVSKGHDFTYQLVLNTAPTAGKAQWCPGWIIRSYSGAILTVAGGTEYLDDHPFPEGAICKVILGDGTVDVETTVSSWTSTTITLADAPTYDLNLDIAYITFMDYTDYTAATQIKYVWAADDSGVMSNADSGKELF